jgi:hypothetical protein
MVRSISGSPEPKGPLKNHDVSNETKEIPRVAKETMQLNPLKKIQEHQKQYPDGSLKNYKADYPVQETLGIQKAVQTHLIFPEIESQS